MGTIILILPGADTQPQVAQMFADMGDYYSQPWS